MLPHLPQCGIQSQQQGMESHTLLPNKLLQVGEHQHHLQAELGDLNDHEL